MRSKLKLGTLAIGVGGIGIVLSGAWMSGCTGTPGTQKGDPSGGNLGSAKLAFEAGPGIIIDTISYTLTGPGGFSRNGSIDVSHSSTLGGVIGNIPSGNGYILTPNATATDGSTTCLGTSAPFNVLAGTTVMVSFRL